MHHINLKVQYFLQREITEIYIMNAFRSFAYSTVALFVPIFLLKQGFNLFDVAFFLFFLAFNGTYTTYAALKFASKKGVKHCLFLSIPFGVMFFLMLYNIEWLLFMNKYLLLFLLAFVKNITGSLYFMGFHLEFAKYSEERNSIKQLGTIKILSTVLSVIGPLFGAIIIEYFSFNILFILIIFLLVVGMIPLLFSKEYHEPFDFNLSELSNVHSKEKNFIPFVAEGFRCYAARYFWPILLFVSFGSITQIGGLYAVSNFLLVIMTYFVSKYSTGREKKVLKYGLAIQSLSFIVRGFVKTFSTLFLIQGIGGLSAPLIELPFISEFYRKSKKFGMSLFIYFREFYLHIGRMSVVIVFVIFAFIFESTKNSLMYTIILSGIIMLFMILIKE